MAKFIKLKCVLMSFVLIITAIFISTPLAVFSETVKVGYIFETGVNIREKATTSSNAVKKVSEIYVTVTGSKNDEKSAKNPETNKVYIWYEISFKSSSETFKGFVREDLIKVTEYKLDTDFAQKLKSFPESYHDDLILLHAMYPNWTFTADKVPKSLKNSVADQDELFRKVVQSEYNSWRSMRKGCYSWSKNKFVETDTGGWYGASREVIAYYMDPRNFLNPNDIFQYMQQTFDAKSQNLAGIELILDGSFMDATISDKSDKFNGKRFAEVILEAAKQSSVNPYVLASTIIQEQGRDGGTLSKGVTYKKKTVYNFFNYGASGANEEEVVENGKKYAYNNNWNTRSVAIIEGSKKYGSGYIKVGQDTYFYKNYNILNPDNLSHQYAQNVADSLNSSRILRSAYSGENDLKLNFRIPVYTSYPSSVSKLPSKSQKLNNYYFDDISADGLTPSYDRYTLEYALSVDGDTQISVTLPNGASLTSDDTFKLKKGENEVKLVIKSQTGYKNTYVINVDAEKECKLTLDIIKNTDSQDDAKVVLGDTNGDKKVTTSDLANVRLHLLKLIKLKDSNLKGADTNGDGKITTSDLANIRLHLLKLIKLK